MTRRTKTILTLLCSFSLVFGLAAMLRPAEAEDVPIFEFQCKPSICGGGGQALCDQSCASCASARVLNNMVCYNTGCSFQDDCAYCQYSCF